MFRLLPETQPEPGKGPCCLRSAPGPPLSYHAPMNSKIILCPGQGAQTVGMGNAWRETSKEARAIFNKADKILGDTLGAPLSTLCAEGPSEALNRTDISQPALFVAAAACLAGAAAQLGWKKSESPSVCAGLSLGEYTALYAAGAISFEDGLRLVTLRGRAMQDAAENQASGMVAFIGGDEQQAQAICDLARGDDVLVCANFNAPGQVVVSGGTSACQRATTEAEAAGLKATQLPVAGAFHSPLMQPAADRLGEALEKTKIAEPKCPVLSNVTGEPHEPGDAGTMEASIRRKLVEQLTNPVRWARCCRWILKNAEGELIELAPGKTLAGLMRRIERGTKVKSYDDPSAIS